MVKKISIDKSWQAEDDARTLAKYQEIMSSTQRKNAAIKAAQKQAADLTKRAEAMKLACGGKLKK